MRPTRSSRTIDPMASPTPTSPDEPTVTCDPHEAATLVRAAAPAPPPPLRFGAYEVVHEIARGGMGVVYEARDTRLRRNVALKVIRELPTDPATRDEAIARFRREATVAARLTHPGIVAIHEVGESVPDTGGPTQHWIAMELVRGRSFSAALATLSTDESVRILAAVATAVGYAHEHGVIHRDLKPANVLLEEGGRVVVTDFGLARHTDDTTLTQDGAVMGTAAYMAPEQVEGDHDRIGRASDVWALGVMLYLVIARKAPFEGRTAPELYVKILQQEVPALQDVAPAASPALVAICHKALERDLARRYPSAVELAEDLARALAGSPVAARAPSRARRLARRLAKRPVLLAGLAALAIAAAWGAHQVARRGQFDDARAAAEAAARAGNWNEARLAAYAALELEPDARVQDLAHHAERQLALASQRADALAREEQRQAAKARELELARAGLRVELAPVQAAIETAIAAYYDADSDRSSIAARLTDLSGMRDSIAAAARRPGLVGDATAPGLLGQIAYLRGDYANALASFEEAARRLDGSEATNLYRLSCVLIDLAAFASVGAEGRGPRSRARAVDARRAAAAGAYSDHPGDTAGKDPLLDAALHAIEAWATSSPTAAEAVHSAIALAKDSPGCENLHVLLGVLDPARRDEHWLRAQELRPLDPRLAYLLAVGKRAHFIAQAHGDLDFAIATAPDLAPAYLERADLLLELDPQMALPAALADLERAADLLPRSPHPWERRALALEVRRPDDAAIAATTALDLDPDAVEALACRGRLHARAGRHAAAVDDLAKAVSLEPAAWETWADLGSSHASLGDAQAASAAFARALELAPAERKGELERRRAGG